MPMTNSRDRPTDNTVQISLSGIINVLIPTILVTVCSAVLGMTFSTYTTVVKLGEQQELRAQEFADLKSQIADLIKTQRETDARQDAMINQLRKP